MEKQAGHAGNGYGHEPKGSTQRGSMRAFEGIEARLKQLGTLWDATATERAKLEVREELAQGEAMRRVPKMPDRKRAALTPVNFAFLPSALRSSAHLWRVEPERTSEHAGRWREILWDFRTPGWLTRHMREVDKTSRLHGACLYVVTTERDEPDDEKPAGLSLQVFPPTRFVALSHAKDDRIATAALILWHAAKTEPTATAEPLKKAPSYSQLMSSVRSLQLGTIPDSSGRSVWLYLDETERRVYEGEPGSLTELESERVKHGYGRCPAGFISSDAIQLGLEGHPWCGSDFVENILSTSHLLTETGETGILQRGQPTSTGTIKGGAPVLGPTHLIEMELGGTFEIKSNGGQPLAMVEVGKVYSALLAVGCDVPISSTWRLADLTDADIAAAELVLSSDRSTRAPIMALAEYQIAKTCVAVWKRESGEELSPWRTVFKAPTPPLTAADRLAHAEVLDERKLAPRIEVAAVMRPELQREELEEQLAEANDERTEETADRVAIAGHAGDLNDERTEPTSTGPDSEPDASASPDDDGRPA